MSPPLLAVPSEKIDFEVMPPDHFACYRTEWAEVVIYEDVYLGDQFGAIEASVRMAEWFCNPVKKWHGDLLMSVSDPRNHLTIYHLYYEDQEQFQGWLVEVDNQFGTQELIVWGPVALGVPTQKLEPGYQYPPVGLDHFLLYEVADGPYVEVDVGLQDQFGYEPEEVSVAIPVYFANPVQKTHTDTGVVTEIENPDEHLVFYEILGSETQYPQVRVVNQFGEQTFSEVYGPYLLAVPSEKLYYEPW
jgi:hypothetical protein